jgi:hypothetical protein
MEEFLRETLKSARVSADSFLDKLEKSLGQSTPQDSKAEPNIEQIYKNLYEEYKSRWEAVSDQLEEAEVALKLMLDGEMEKIFVVPAEKSRALEKYSVETFWTDPVDGPMELNVKQRKL